MGNPKELRHTTPPPKKNPGQDPIIQRHRRHIIHNTTHTIRAQTIYTFNYRQITQLPPQTPYLNLRLQRIPKTREVKQPKKKKLPPPSPLPNTSILHTTPCLEFLMK